MIYFIQIPNPLEKLMSRLLSTRYLGMNDFADF